MKKYVCMLLMFCMFLGCFAGCNVAEKDSENGSSIDSRFETDKGTVDQTEKDETWLEGIDSLDEVNYYAGLMVLMGKESSQTMANATSAPSVSPLSVSQSHTKRTDYWNISNEQMTITVAICFTIEVTEADTFLASKVGIGTVSVMITDLKVRVTEPNTVGNTPLSMITFKNGEKYYSCLSKLNDLQSGENKFYSNQYIDGFCVVDTSETDGWFSVAIDMENQTMTACDWSAYRQEQSDGEKQPLELVGDGIEFYHGYHVFTLDSLLNYYRKPSSEGETSEKPSESGTNPWDSVHLESGMSASRVEVVEVDQKNIPGQRLAFNLLFVDNLQMGSRSFLMFESEEEFRQFVEGFSDAEFGQEKKVALMEAVKQVNFEDEYLIAVMAQYCASDVDENGNGFGINEVILQNYTLLFIYESMYTGKGQNDGYCQSSFLTVKKSDFQNGIGKYEIYAYSTQNARSWASYYYHHYQMTTIVSYH